jgi:propionyl-CoA carboxylase alpha chain
VTWGPDREAAIDAQIDALDRFHIEGIGHNVDFLSAVMQHPRFRVGEITTGFIAEEFADGFSGAPASDALNRLLAAVAAGLSFTMAGRALRISGQLGEAGLPGREWLVRIDGKSFPVTLKEGEAEVAGETVRGTIDWEPGQRAATAISDELTVGIGIRRNSDGWTLTTRGAAHRVQVYPAHVAELTRHMIEKVPPDLSRLLLAPMPGLLTRLDVAVGDRVEAGQAVAVMEAMKMENILRASRAANVKAVPARVGDGLAVDQLIVEFE